MLAGDLMFFVRQYSQECGLHAIKNMFKSSAVTRADMHDACRAIEKRTGDTITNHESYSGDWSCSAVLETIRARGYTAKRAVHETAKDREWKTDDLQTLLQDDSFRGIILHQPFNHHFTCVRPETTDGERRLYYVDSMARGPIRISPRLVTRRCLSKAYRWEPYVVHGPEMEYVAPTKVPRAVIDTYCSRPIKRSKFTPTQEFLTAWRSAKAHTK